MGKVLANMKTIYGFISSLVYLLIPQISTDIYTLIVCKAW